jgi:transglutaminase-like putative cysteine protease
MKRKKRLCGTVLAFCFFLISSCAKTQDVNPCSAPGQTCYFGVEMNGILFGYSVENYCTALYNDRQVSVEKSIVKLKMSLLGAAFDTGFESVYIIDPATDRATESMINVINGESVMRFVTRISGDTAYYESPTSGIKKAIPAGEDVIFNSLTRHPHLFRDFIGNGIAKKTYRVLDPIEGKITEKNYSRKSEEKITLCDSVFNCLVLEETDFSTGVRTTLWLNKADGYNVKAIVSGRTIYLADKSVTSKITTADINNLFFARVGRTIPNIFDLVWFKVKANINSYGEDLTDESLNFPGQKFEGTVTGNNIDGVFEIEPLRYTGKNSPPFPPDFRTVKELKKYLEPEIMIECDDPLIINEAAQITSGAKDSWDAVVRLSRWVAENIAGALPGGVSAINTLRTMEAECGGHSRLLAALCRAVGIPSRLAVGCMYLNYYTGGFGQHAWTEVYMGDAGWIPVDATVAEIDYIDAGHIRLGENTNFRPVSMEIIDLRTGQERAGESVDAYLTAMEGSFINLEQYRMFKIISRNGSVAIDIPGRVVLQLNPPDDHGRWFPTLTREISLSPEKNEKGEMDRIILHEYTRLKKISQSETIPDKTPEELRDLAGKYQVAPSRLSLDVAFAGEVMTTSDPAGSPDERISFTRAGNTWIDRKGKYEITFVANSENDVTALILSNSVPFVRGEPVTHAVEPVVKASGVKAGMRKYDEIKRSRSNKYLFSVHMLHDLGHRLLQENRIDDAIIVFRKNVREYPGSFMVNDALAETYLKNEDNKLALKYFKAAVRLNPDYEYGRKIIDELRNK